MWDGAGREGNPPHNPQEAVDELVFAVLNYAEAVFHGNKCKDMVPKFLSRVSKKVRLIPGCLTADIHLDGDDLVDLLNLLPQLSIEIKEKVFDRESLIDPLRNKFDPHSWKLIENLVEYVKRKASVVISLQKDDLVNFLDDKKKKKTLTFVIQIRVLSRVSSTSEANRLKCTKFIRAFSRHAEVKQYFMDILQEGDDSSSHVQQVDDSSSHAQEGDDFSSSEQTQQQV